MGVSCVIRMKKKNIAWIPFNRHGEENPVFKTDKRKYFDKFFFFLLATIPD